MLNKKKVLFLCTGNSCRSQIAEGFLRHLASEDFEAFSAGTKPSRLNPLAVKVMEEKGVDISGQYSQSIDEFLNESLDYIITVCDHAKETCPVFPGTAERIHWSFRDPADAKGSEEEKMTVFREIRDSIEKNIKNFIKKQ
jgi:arsenate reductase (thioredoxin)